MPQTSVSERIKNDGYVIIEDVLAPEFIAKAKAELERALTLEQEYHHGKEYADKNMVLLCSLYGGSFWKLFENEKFISPFEEVLGSGCITYAYTSSSMPPGAANYSARIHVDCPRLIQDYVTNIGATILLDDFTEENGATWFLPASHTLLEQPDDKFFFNNAQRVVRPAGSVFLFNARLWHAGGQNQTDRWRHALTINMCRPWMKQRLDIPRSMEKLDLSAMSEVTKQKLGFYAQVPASYDEYYVPPAERKFRQKAE